ncbi:MAG: hypothetical protein WB821_16810 [Burkholderiaceae bacterium]
MPSDISPATTNSPALLEGPFNGRTVFQQLVRDALAAAAREGWREIILCDASFDDWPLGERAVVESLSAWSKTGRTFTLLAKRYEGFGERLPRFVTWRGRWSHIINAHAVPSADALDLPSAIYSPNWVMHRIDPVHCKGIASHDAQRRVALREDIEAWLHKSSPAFAATTLGL